MKYFFFSAFFAIAMAGNSQEVRVMNFSELQLKMLTSDAPLTIFNFWATWCGPCVRELPHFEAYINHPNVKVYLVSLDFVEDLEKVKKFVSNKGIKTSVVFLNEKDYDSYMSKVSKDWTGAIPATLFVDSNGKTYFHESEFSKEDLETTIISYLK